MYFFKTKGKQHLDLRGDLILTHNAQLVRTRARSNAPRYVQNAKYITSVGRYKIRATWAAAKFIWGKSTAIDTAVINKENGLK